MTMDCFHLTSQAPAYLVEPPRREALKIFNFRKVKVIPKAISKETPNAKRTEKPTDSSTERLKEMSKEMLTG
jgi:hypothetical protein